MVGTTFDTAPGLLTTINTGAVDGGAGERVLIDYKDAIMDYKVTDLAALSMFAEPMSTDTGGDIDITFGRPSMGMQEIEEGNTPQYQHTNLRSERVTVGEWGLALGVTRRMIEDSRFNEVEMALNEARRAVDRHITKHVMYALLGVGNSGLGTGVVSGGTADQDILAATKEVAQITSFSDNIYSGFLGSGGTVDSGRINSYGLSASDELVASHYVAAAGTAAGSFALKDVTTSLDLIAAHGYMADTVVISPKHYKSLLDLGDFVTAFTAAQGSAGTADGSNPTTAAMMPGSPVANTASTGIVGSIYGLSVIVNAWCPSDRCLIYDSKVKPMVYVERRPLTVEEANPGFGIIGSYMSMRYGLKVVRPEVGVVLYNTGQIL